MAYAEGRTFHDADSHIMELPDFLTDARRPPTRALPQIPGRARRSRVTGSTRLAMTRGQPRTAP